MVDKLKATKKIERYFKTFRIFVQYEIKNKFYKFIFSEKNLKSHLLIASFMRRLLSKKTRKYIE